MSIVSVSCPFEDCKFFGKTVHVESDQFRKHLARDHDRFDLRQFALKKGIIQDDIRFHNDSYIIRKIAESSKITGDLYNGSN